MKPSEAKRTILMLATQLATARHRARVANLDLKMMIETVKELSAANRDKELELRAYREEEAARTTTPAQEPSPAPSAMSFGEAVELMARRPGLELVDNELDRWRNHGGQLQIRADGGRQPRQWENIDIDHDWTLLRFRIAS